MNYEAIRQSTANARSKLLRTLKKSITTYEGKHGSGQFISEKGPAEHVGVYGTSAIIEAIGQCEPTFADIHKFIPTLAALDTPKSEDEKQDSKITFKLCAAINALKTLQQSGSSNQKSDDLLRNLAQKLKSMSKRDDIDNITYWLFSPNDANQDPTHHTIPTAYATHALSNIIPANELRGAVKFLCEYTRTHAINGGHPKITELAPIMLALDSYQTERRNHISDKEFKNLEYYLYKHFVSKEHFDETFINFIHTPFASLFYVIKTDLVILKYFLIANSKYLKSQDVFNKIQGLLKSINNNEKYISTENQQASVRENALACRVLDLLEKKLYALTPNKILSVWYRFEWNPKPNIQLAAGRTITAFFILAAPAYTTIFSGKSLENLLAVTTGIISSFIFEYLRRK